MTARERLITRFDAGWCACGACEQEFVQLLDALEAEVQDRTLSQAAETIFVTMHDKARTAKPGWCGGMISAAGLIRPKPTGPLG